MTQTYETAEQYHNPMEPHAIVAAWQGDTLSIDTPSQGLAMAQGRLAGLFGMAPNRFIYVSRSSAAASQQRSDVRTAGSQRHRRPRRGPAGQACTATRADVRSVTSFAAPTLECSDVRLGWQETRNRVLELRRPVTMSRDIRSLGRMNDDRTDLEVFQQCRDLVFGDWTSAATFVPLHIHATANLDRRRAAAPLLRCYLRAVLGKHRPQCREELNSHAGLIWIEKGIWKHDVPARANHHLHAAQFATAIPIGTQPIVKTGRLRRLQFLDDTDVVGSPPRKVRRHEAHSARSW